MEDREDLLVVGEKFAEALEAEIQKGEGPFAVSHPFLPTALRGLAERLNSDLVPMGFVMATEIYVYDVQTGTNGFTGEPMPREVVGMPSVMTAIIKMAAEDVARQAYGDEFVDAVSVIRQEVARTVKETTD